MRIDILEASALARLFTALAIEGGPLRFVNLCDSFVARAAVSKGRSGLRHATRRTSTVALVGFSGPCSLHGGGGLYANQEQKPTLKPHPRNKKTGNGSPEEQGRALAGKSKGRVKGQRPRKGRERQ